MRKTKNIVLTLAVAALGFGCSDFLNPSVDQAIPVENAAKNASDLEALVLGVHDRMNAVGLYGRDMYVSGDVMSDNAFSNGNSGRFVTQGDFNQVTSSAFASGIWNGSYSAIANANIVINSSVASSPKVDYLKGQAYALRALNHFNVLIWFGQQYVTGGNNLGIPYVTTYAEGDLYPSRLTVAEVYTKIEDDLAEAATLMSAAITADATVEDGSAEYINYLAVKGLQSRVYLFDAKYDQAIAAADVVISSGSFTMLDQASYFAAWTSGTGPSSLFEMAFTSTDRLGTDNIARIYRETNYGDIEATPDLYNSYNAADVRRTLYTDVAGKYRMANKYVDELGTDNVRVLRYEEVLLNKAEALAKKGGASLAQALVIINDISSTRGAGSPYTTGNLTEVLAERRLELAFEGHRFFDLARNGMAIPIQGSRNIIGVTNVVPALTAMPFGDYRYALPIPQSEIDANSNMVQNKDYGL